MIAQDGPAPAVLRKAIELQKMGKYAEAIEAYQALLRAQPDAAGVRSNL
jgi:tetratricopeptide (TPR) repeat protein